MVIGQMQELDYQRVDHNGKIKQYAIVEEIGDAAFRYPCPDCTCTLTMTDSEGFVIKNSEPCTDELNGLFTNVLYESNLHASQTYELRHYCISATYGNGTVISSLQIDSKETSIDFSASSEEISAQVTDVTAEGCQRTDSPSAILPDFNYYSCLYWQALTGLYRPLIDIEKAIKDFKTGFGKGLTVFDTASAPFRYAFNLITDFYNDPVSTFEALAYAWLAMLWGIISAFGMLWLVLEMYIIFKIIGNPSGIGMIADFIQENLRVLSWIFDKTMSMLMFIANLIPGT